MRIDQEIERNKGLVFVAAKRFAWTCEHGATFDELLQGGRIGLWKAIETFDPARGGFSGHVLSKARAGVQAAFAECPAIRRVQVGAHRVYKIRKFRSLDKPIGEEDSGITYLDQLVDRCGDHSDSLRDSFSETPLVRLISEERRHLVEDALRNARLTQRECEVVCRRFGITGIAGNSNPDEMLQPEIAAELGITKQRVEQLETSALKKLRLAKNFHQLREIYLS